MERNRRKERVGVVTSDKMNKTRIVQVERTFRHPMYEKVMTRRHKYYAHDEKNESHAGDRVRIMETRAVSKSKRWLMVGIVENGK
jgi:small subunit ribosomal protein S17